MTSEYVRRKAPLAISGISTEKYPGHPSPDINESFDDDDDADQLPRVSPFDRSVSSFSDRLQLPAAQWGILGDITERSNSVFSFGDDEYDRQAAEEIKTLFDNLEMILFENQMRGSSQLLEECRDWVSRFPHLRVTGKQNFSSEDLGFALYNRPDGFATSYDSGSGSESDSTPRQSEILTVGGTHMDVFRPFSTDSLLAEEWKEEVFDQEGCVEEILAFDPRSGSSDDDDYQNEKTSRSFARCARSRILQEAFSDIWGDVVYELRTLLKVYIDNVMIRTRHIAATDYLPGPTNDFFLREFTSQPANQQPTLPDKLQMTRQTSNVSGVGSLKSSAKPLTGVLTIFSKTIQSRDKDGSHDTETAIVPMTSRLFNPKTDARVRFSGRQKLAPISSSDRLKTPNLDEDKHANLIMNEIIRGHRMPTISESYRLPESPSRMGGQLPPISRDAEVVTIHSSNVLSGKKTFQRARSALPNKDSKTSTLASHLVVEKSWMSASRPNTMQSLNSADLPQTLGSNGRSKTTLGNYHGNQVANAVLHRDRRKPSVSNTRSHRQSADWNLENTDDNSFNEIAINTSKYVFSKQQQRISNTVLRPMEGPVRINGPKFGPHHYNVSIR